MSSQAGAALIAAAMSLIAAPYLARLTLTVPDGDVRRWYRGAPASHTRTVVTALVAVVLGLLAGMAAHVGLLLIPFVLLVLVGAPLSVIDLEHHRLPNRLVFVLAIGAPVLGLLPAAFSSGGERWSDYGRAAAGAGAVFVVLFVLTFAFPRAFGYGDVKLAGVLGGYLGWFGWFDVYYGIFAGFVLGSLVSVVLLAAGRANRKTPIPFGPMMLVGALAVLAFRLVPTSG